MKLFNFKHLLYLLPLLFVGCKDNGPDNNPKPIGTSGVYVCNEGNFLASNATLSFYNKDNDQVEEPLALSFEGSPFPLGDICQSMTIFGNRGYVVMNNSAKVYVFDLETNEFVGRVPDLPSPRYVAFQSETKAYVSDLYSPLITIFNPKTCHKIGTVNVGRSTEQLVCYGTSLFACNWSYGNQIYRIDTQTDRVVDSLKVTLQPNSMVLDKNGKLWVLSDGSYFGSGVPQEMPALTRIDAQTFKIEQVFPFGDMDCYPSRLTIDGAGDRLFCLVSGTSGGNDGVYAIDITADGIPATPLIAQTDSYFYGLGVDPDNGDIYVSDAIDYMQPGVVYRYDSSGAPLREFKVGIIPGSFCFRPTAR